jgi:hypothetical protein
LGSVLVVGGLVRVAEAGAIGDITTFAGSGSGDGRAASTVGLNGVSAVAVDPAGNTYVIERFAHRVRRVDAGSGVITTIAGTGVFNDSGDNGAAVSAAIAAIAGLAVGPGNVLYVGTGARVRRIDLTTGIITTYAGGGSVLGDGGPAIAARFQDIGDIAVNAAGDVYVADRIDNRIRKVALATGIITTVAGTGVAGSTGDNGQATAALLRNPEGVAVDAAGDI